MLPRLAVLLTLAAVLSATPLAAATLPDCARAAAHDEKDAVELQDGVWFYYGPAAQPGFYAESNTVDGLQTHDCALTGSGSYVYHADAYSGAVVPVDQLL